MNNQSLNAQSVKSGLETAGDFSPNPQKMCTETHTHIITTLVVTLEPTVARHPKSKSSCCSYARPSLLICHSRIFDSRLQSGSHLLLRREPSVCHVRHGEAISASQHTFCLFIIPVHSLTNKPADAELGCLFTPTDTTEAPTDLPSGCVEGGCRHLSMYV